jgi:uncharacterized membrane protein HdeD (DUF308 family)
MSDAVDSPVRTQLSNHWWLFLIEGLVLLVLGVTAILVPPIASIAIALFLGWVFLIGGGIGLVASIAGRRAPGFWWSLASSILSIVVGAWLVASPFRGAISLTFLLTLFLFADGILMILFAIDHRRLLSKRWYWIFANGVIDIILAAAIMFLLPISALWVLGLIVGIDLIFGGWSLIAVALEARRSVEVSSP